MTKLAQIRDVLVRNCPGLTVETLDKVLDRKLYRIVEDRIEALISAQVNTLTLPELIALHFDLTAVPEPSRAAGFEVPDLPPIASEQRNDLPPKKNKGGRPKGYSPKKKAKP